MSKRFFVDDAVTEDGKYRVLQEDSKTKERFGVKDFETKEEAQRKADDLQKGIDKAFSEEDTLKDFEVPFFMDGQSETPQGNDQDIKNETSEE